MKVNVYVHFFFTSMNICGLGIIRSNYYTYENCKIILIIMKTFLLLILVILAFCGFQCSEAKNELVESEKVHYELDSNRIAIFKKVEISNSAFKNLALGRYVE
jgi:hypothetical protein